ncbi:MAG: hypothetical protein KDB67_05935 [Gordonia sp.]|uniref:hypothetical protein n=1 Tax=Gordonia sp. (in: high G+C Gram-positive bacteria) TaxID=84139 RepID=UPI001D775151|nr:hypothetical protein [Gordonia sp. (in: high G+C Gram-positive bacteria)]
MSSDPKENPSLIILEGLLASIALGMLAGDGWQMAASMGGFLAVVTAVAYRMGGPIADVAGWCYSGIGLIALLPALLGLNGSGCGDGFGSGQQYSLTGAFALTWLVVTAKTLAFRWSVSDFRYLPLSWVGIIEAIQFWSRPQPWTALGDYQVSMFVAIGAAIVCGLLVGIRPVIGMAVIGTALGLAALMDFVAPVANCENLHTDSAIMLMLTYLIVLFFSLWAMSRMRRR